MHRNRSQLEGLDWYPLVSSNLRRAAFEPGDDPQAALKRGGWLDKTKQDIIDELDRRNLPGDQSELKQTLLERLAEDLLAERGTLLVEFASGALGAYTDCPRTHLDALREASSTDGRSPGKWLHHRIKPDHDYERVTIKETA